MKNILLFLKNIIPSHENTYRIKIKKVMLTSMHTRKTPQMHKQNERKKRPKEKTTHTNAHRNEHKKEPAMQQTSDHV